MVVTVLAEDHATGRGPGHADGIDAPLSAAAVAQLCCSNGIQPVALGSTGKVHRLGTTERCFNRAQRRALTARDGGCIICGLRAGWCEAHHVVPWATHPSTHVDNGVLLCWYHHRTIHTSGWKIRMQDGSPQILPPPDLGPPVWQPARQSATRHAAAITQRLRL